MLFPLVIEGGVGEASTEGCSQQKHVSAGSEQMGKVAIVKNQHCVLHVMVHNVYPAVPLYRRPILEPVY